jgi:photosystem II stability/assembly factor-like uncharacterized protein
MRYFPSLLLLVLAMTLSACNLPGVPAAEAPLTPFPDTPAPAEINASLVDSPALMFFDMLDEVNGWGVTEALIVRTNDGGVTWYNVTPPGLTEAGYSLGTTFLDAQHAWLQAADINNYPIAGTLYRTADGGLTWTSLATPFSGGHMTFLDANQGWMMADLGAGAGSNAVSVFQTNDGGTTWTQPYTNDPNRASAGDSLPLGGLKGGLVPLDMQTAWIGGVIYSPATLYLYRTDDGGRNWVQVELPLPPEVGDGEVAVNGMAFITPTDGILALRITSNEMHTAVYLTDDSGATWTLTPTLLPEAGSVNLLSAQDLIYYGEDQFQVSRDAGQTWETISPDILFGESFSSMEFVNLSTGWVLTSDQTNRHTLYRTTDGGATWSPIIP